MDFKSGYLHNYELMEFLRNSVREISFKHALKVSLLVGVLLFLNLKFFLALREWFRTYRLCKLLPGPEGHFIFGNAKEFLSKHKFFDYCSKWRLEFPDFHKTTILFHPLIIAQSPRVVQEILSRKHKHSEKGFIYRGLRPLLGEGLITSKGERWQIHRKLITPTFHFNILESFVDVFVNRTNNFLKELKICAEKSGETDYIDINPLTRKLTLDFICETAMGTTLDSDSSTSAKIVSAMHKLEEIGTYRMVRPWLLSDFIFSFTAKGKEENFYKNILHTFTDEVITRRRSKLKMKGMPGANDENSNIGMKKKAIFMDLLIECSDNGNVLTNEDIRQEVNTFMFAGQNTTQLAINYCLYLLGHHSDIQEKVHRELRDIFQGTDRDPTMEDLKNMKYLENCIKDALRLFPSVPVIARRLTEDEHIDNHLLPKGADVLILPYVLHRNPEQFPYALEFNPDNFLPEHVKDRHPYAYIPFSAGPRNCIGQKFAVLAEKTVISSIIRRYRITSKGHMEDLVVVPNTVLVPKSGIRLNFQVRK